MKNLNRIFKWLSIFEEKEKKEFLSSVRKLQKVRKQRTKKLAEYIWECAEKNHEPDIKAVSMMFYKKTTFDDTQMRNYLSKTWYFVEDFLVHQHMQNELRRKQALQELAEERRIYDEFEEINTELITNNKLHIGREGHFNKYLWQAKKYFWEGNELGKVKKSRTEFKELINTLEQTYLIAKLQLLCEQQSRTFTSNDTEHLTLTESLLASIKEFQEENPIIKLYYIVYLLVYKESIVDASKLKELFYSHSHLLGKQEQLQLLVNITNHLIHNFNQYNDKESIKTLLDFYKLRMKLNQENIDTNEIFSPYIFINITQIAVAQFELKFAKDFITTYSKRLPLNTRNLIVQLCNAIILHKEEYFENAYLLLQNLKTSDKKVAIRIFTYKILCLVDYNFFEDNDREIVRESSYTFKKWLDRNKSFFGENPYALYNNFIQFSLKLIAQNLDLNELEKEIKNTSYVGSKNWLLRKVRQLKEQRQYA